MGVEDNLFQIGSLDQTDTFYDWFNKTNNEIIAKLNNLTVYSGLSGDGINVLVGTTSGTGTAGVMQVSIADSVTKGVTFQGDVTINGLLNYSGGLNLPTGFRIYSGPSGGTAGFTYGNVVRVIDYDGGVPGGTSGIGLTLANASSASNAEAIGLVKTIGSNYIDVVMNGELSLSDWSGALDTGNTLNSGCVYFLSTTNGKITKTEPTTAGLVTKPMVLGVSGDRGGVLHYRGQLLTTGSSGASAGSIAVNTAIVDLSSDSFVATNGVGATQLKIGTIVSKKKGTISTSATTPSYVFPSAYSNIAGFCAGTGGPTADKRKYYGGYYLASASDPDVPPINTGTNGEIIPSLSEVIGVVKSYPGGTLGTLMEITIGGAIYPTQDRVNKTSNTVLVASGYPPLYITPSDIYVNPDLGDFNYSAGCFDTSQTSAMIALPIDSSGTYVLKEKVFSSAEVLAAEAREPVAENMAVNGSLEFWQREVGTSTAATGGTSDNGFYFADSWVIVNGISSGNSAATGQFQVQRQSFTKGQVEVLGEPNYYVRYSSTLSGISGSTHSYEDYVWVENRIPDSTVGAAEPCIISFYAKSDTAGVNMDVYYNQYWRNAAKNDPSYFNEQKIGTVSLGTSWERYTLALQGVTPSTIVTGDDHYASVSFDMVNLGSGYIDLAQLVFEKGNVARRPVKIDYENELTKMQRSYQKSYAQGVKPGSATMVNTLQTNVTPVIFTVDSSKVHYFKFPSRTRKTPTVTIYSPKSGTQSDGLNLSATNSYEALDMRLTSGSTNLDGSRRTSITGNPTISTTVSSEGLVIDLLGGILTGDKIALHYVADADINKNFKRK